jgi:hypothetical protein
VHVEFQSFLAELECEPLAFDYVLDSETVLMAE